MFEDLISIWNKRRHREKGDHYLRDEPPCVVAINHRPVAVLPRSIPRHSFWETAVPNYRQR